MAHLLVEKEKKRYISCIVYVPDDAVEWTDEGYVITDSDKVEGRYNEICAYLDNQRIQCCISPLHYADKYDSDGVKKWVKNHAKDGKLSVKDLERCPKVGQVKKPHWHVLTYSKGGRTIAGMQKIYRVLGVTSYWVEDDPDVAIRYQAHMDSPEKTRYDEREIRAFGGMNIDAIDKMSKADRLGTVEAICNYVKEHECTNFYDLTNAMLTYNDATVFDCLINKTAFFINYMRGLQEKLAIDEKLHEH